MPATAATERLPREQTHPDLSGIYRLADHLDATLAMAEDLLHQSLDVAPLAAGDANAAITERNAALSAFAQTVRALELGMTARLLQARTRAIEVRHAQEQFAPLIGLFIGGTAPLADAAAGLGDGLGDISELALTSGPDVLVFLKSRGIVDASVPALQAITSLAVGEGYVLAGHIHLGTLMDMLGAFLESLDLAFDLYAATPEDAAAV